MKSAVEGDEFFAARVVAREFDGGLDRFGAGIAVIDALLFFAGRDGGEFFGELDHVRVVEIGARHVDQFGGLPLNRGDHVGMAMSGGNHGDAGGEIDERIAVHVFDERAAPAGGDERVAARIRR